MRASTVSVDCYGGPICRRQQLPAPQYFSPSSLCLHPCDSRHRWSGMHANVEVIKSRRLGARANAKATTEGDVMPYGAYLGGKEYYLDEQDVVTFLDPPKELIPLDPSSYNAASYIWKKIGDIPEERRHRLLSLLNPRLRSRAWEVAGTRYDDPKLAKKSASTLLSDGGCVGSHELWQCRTSGAPLPIAWIHASRKAIFGCTDGKTYGCLIGGHSLSGIFKSLPPLYFSVRQVNEVMSTEQPCDLAYEFGDGLVNLPVYPQDYPEPSKHPWPFNDQVVIYVRQLGPGVAVGQAWQEGVALQQVPKKLCNEILMVKDQ